MILELTPAQIKETQERFAMAAKEAKESEGKETVAVFDMMDDSLQMVRK